MGARRWLLLAVGMASGCASSGWERVDPGSLAGEAAEHPDDPVLVLLDEVRVRYFEDPATGEAAFDQTNHERMLILRDTEDLEDLVFAHDRTFRVLQGVRARVIRSGGEVREYGRADAADVAAFSDTLFSDKRRLSLGLGSPPVGSVVEWEYTLRSSGRLLAGGQYFQRGWPVKTARLVVDAPAGWELEATPRGEGVPPPQVVRDGETVRRTWEMHDLPPLRREPLQGNWFGPQVLVRLLRWTERGKAQQSFRDPRELSAFVHRLYGAPPPLDPEMKALVGKVTKETQEPRERARRLYEWVRDEVKYCAIEVGWGGWKPIPAGDVFRGRYGDCKGKANLLHVLLAEAGIPSRHVLVFAHDVHGGEVEPEPFRLELGMNNFNHQILIIDFPDGPLVVDPTSVSPFGQLPLGDQEADLLPVSEPGSDLLKAAASGPAENVFAGTLALSLARDGDVKGSFSADVQGAEATQLAYALAAVGDRRVPDFLEDRLGPLHLSASVMDDIRFSGGKGEPLKISARVSWSRFARSGAGVLMLRLADVRPKWLPVFPDEPRRTPIALGPRRTVREVLQLAIPGVARVSAVPPPAHVTAPGLEYDLKWKQEEGRIVAERTLVVSELAVPSGAYDELKETARRIHAAEAQAVVLEMPR